MTLADIKTLFEYNSWAKARLLSALDAMKEDDLYKDLKSSFPGMYATLFHIVSAENIWRQRFSGAESVTPLTKDDAPTYAALKARWNETEKGILSYLDSLTEEQLSGVLTFKNIKGEPVSQLLWQALQHIVNHESYHRGQATTMIRQLGGTPVNTDLIGFYRQRK
ncbi:MAG: DinB family protein [Bacteroidota bacterium]|nr:DinB family protein [Bacteroidota bacterium]